MTTQLELLQSKTAYEMAEYVNWLLNSDGCSSCPANGLFCKKRPRSSCIEILEDYFNSKVKRRQTKK